MASAEFAACVYGLLCQHDDVEIVAINSTSNPEGTAHLFQYDSTHGTYRGDVSFTEDSLVVDGKKIRLLSDRDPKNLPWGDLGVDIVIDSTGKFKSKDDCQVHLDNGAEKSNYHGTRQKCRCYHRYGRK